MELLQQSLKQVIDNLTIISSQGECFSQLEKDILLQLLRKTYLQIYQMESVKSIINEVEKKSDTEFSQQKEQEYDEELKRSKQEIAFLQQQIAQFQDEFIDMQEQLLAIKTEISKKEQLITDLRKKSAENDSKLSEYEHMQNSYKEQIAALLAKETVIEFPKSSPDSQPELFDSPVEPTTFELPATSPTEPIASTSPSVSVQKPAAKSEKRSLNELLTLNREDLGTKFQQSKIEDLAKAISLNDKFTFIRELFHNKGEEFSKVIRLLNNCQTMEQAFDELEKLKQFYLWDSSQSAYLTLCELIRRKFI